MSKLPAFLQPLEARIRSTPAARARVLRARAAVETCVRARSRARAWLRAQYVVETQLLAVPSYRCPYCGAANDSFGRAYCLGAPSCADFFFPPASAAAWRAT